MDFWNRKPKEVEEEPPVKATETMFQDFDRQRNEIFKENNETMEFIRKLNELINMYEFNVLPKIELNRTYARMKIDEDYPIPQNIFCFCEKLGLQVTHKEEVYTGHGYGHSNEYLQFEP